MSAAAPVRIRLAAGVALALVALAALVVVLVGGDPGGRRYVATLQGASGLIAGADVRAGGVRVGRVVSVGLGPRDLPRVVFRTEAGYDLRRGATADLRLGSQAGELNRYLEVTRGRGARLRDGATLGLGQTDQPVELDDALAVLTPATRADVRQLAATLDRGLRGHGGDLRAALAHGEGALKQTAAALGDVAGDGVALRRLVAQGADVTHELAADPDRLAAAADRLAGVLRTTAGREADLGAAVVDLAPALRAGGGALRRLTAAVPRLRATARAAAPVARAARRAAPALAAALQAAPAALAETGALVDQAPANLRRLRPLTQATLPVLRRAPSALAGFAPLLDRLRAAAPDALGWLPLLGDALANYDANGHGARVMLITAQPPATPIGPDDDRPGLLARPFARTPGTNAGEPWKGAAGTYVGGHPAPAPKVRGR